MIFETEMNLDLLAGEHAECLTRIDGHIERLVSVQTISFFIQNGDLFHLKFSFYIYYQDELKTLDEWIRETDLSGSFYFGGTLDYHF